jgi:hypothetical protein
MIMLPISFSRYRREIRIVRPQPNLISYRDAQGFRLGDEKLKVALTPATVYHYGMVKHPNQQLEKQLFFHSLWHDEAWVKAPLWSIERIQIRKLRCFRTLYRQAAERDVAAHLSHELRQVEGDPTTRKPALKIRLKQWVARHLPESALVSIKITG